MVKTADWFDHEDEVLEAIRRRTLVRAPAPEIDGYEHLHELARGGQGVVYLGVHGASGGRVAIKVMREDRFASPVDTLRFEREIEIARTLDHPGIVPVRESGVTGDGRRFLVMRYVDGEPLDEFALGADRSRAFASEAPADAPSAPVRGDAELLRVFADICDAVLHAHQRGVIHRDLKPSNIRVDDGGCPHVLDFGMARPLDVLAGMHTPATAATRTGQFVGSLAWASPEQIEGRPSDVDVRSDVYALGLILFHMLTGRLPYDTGGTLRETVECITQRDPLPPSRFRPIDADVETIVLRCLAKDPQRRYAGAGELVRDVRCHIAGEPIEARRDRAWHRMQTAVRRSRRTALAAGGATIVLAGLLVVIALLWREASNAEALARDRLRQSLRQTEQSRSVIAFLEETIGAFEPVSIDGAEPTVRLALGRAVDRMRWQLADEPMVHAQIAVALGRAFHNLGRYDEAAELLAESRGIMERLERRSNDLVDDEALRRTRAEAIHLTGSVRHTEWRLDEAESMLREALELLGNGRARTDRQAKLPVLLDLASVLGAKGRFDEAERVLRDAIDLGRAVAWDPDGWEGILLERLAAVRMAQNDSEAGEAMFTRARDLLLPRHGPDHMTVLDCSLGLAHVRLSQRRPQEAIEIAQSIEDPYTRQWGRDHQRLSKLHEIQCNAFLQLDDLPAAEVHIDEAVAIIERSLGADNPYLIGLLFRQGLVREKLGRLDEAVHAYRRAVALAPGLPDPAHPEVLAVRGRLGCCLLKAGMRDEARAELRAVLPLLEDRVGRDHTHTRAARACLRAIGPDGPIPETP